MKKRWLLVISMLMISMMIAFSCSTIDHRKNKSTWSRMKQSMQYNEGRFQNPREWKQPPVTDMMAIGWDFLFKDNDRKPKQPLPRIQTELTKPNPLSGNHLSVTWLGHSSLLIYMDGVWILTDPVFEEKVSLVGPTRFSGNLPISIEELPNIDVVVISHDHYDHLNKASLKQLMEKTGVFVMPLGVGTRLKKWGIVPEKIIELDWWEEVRPINGLLLAATPAQHFSGRGVFDRNKTLWSSWVIQSSKHNLYFSGDSGYFDGFKKIGKKYGPFDINFLECGAYNEKWKFVHMFPEETVQAHLDLGGKILHPIHWGTYDLSLHSWYEPMQRVSAAAQSKGVTLATPIVGDTIVYKNNLPTTQWWKNHYVKN